MPIPAGALHARRKARQREAASQRVEASKKAQKKKKTLAAVLKKYDTNSTGQLEVDQLKAMLTDFNNGQEPTEEECQFILRIADTSQQGGINGEEIGDAISAWLVYKDERDVIHKVMEKYDTNKTGQLEREQLAALLLELNNNMEVGDDDVDWVLANADVLGNGAITPMELSKAIAVWFAHVEAHGASTQDGLKASSVCSVL
mmetsp:Transcript_41248/g.89959  ORF Transcript_41248/g.89959 Transcript_41248/m.89959 type:complete len:202 (+) Transcript_41248:30-635(+)